MQESLRKVSGEFSSQKFVVFLESYPKTIRFYPESGVRIGSPKMYVESKGLSMEPFLRVNLSFKIDVAPH